MFSSSPRVIAAAGPERTRRLIKEMIDLVGAFPGHTSRYGEEYRQVWGGATEVHCIGTPKSLTQVIVRCRRPDRRLFGCVGCGEVLSFLSPGPQVSEWHWVDFMGRGLVLADIPGSVMLQAAGIPEDLCSPMHSIAPDSVPR